MKNTLKLALFCFFTIIFSIGTGYSQGEFWNWHFGFNAGIRFPGGGAPIPFTTSACSTAEGSASISDKLGNVLFYTDGSTVYNKLNLTMANGTGLMGNGSSAQSAIIVPRPGSSTIYYVFTCDFQGGANGLRYSTVDMSLASGNGSVTVKNTLLYTPTCEKITAVKHKNGCDIWVLSHHWGSANLYAYLVTAAGVNAVPVISNPGGQVHSGPSSVAIGYMKANPQGTLVAAALATNGSTLTSSLELYDFNAGTGAFTNARMLTTTGNIQTYGCEFSPNGQLLYGACGNIYQFNATLGSAAAISASKVSIGASGALAMQCAPDGKMYCASAGAALSVVNNPNVIGAGCNYVPNTLNLAGKNSCLGLPSFITSWVVPPRTFSFTPNCTTTFTISDTSGVQSLNWNFGDPSTGALNTSTVLSNTSSHLFSGAGTYTVRLILNFACKSDTIFKPVTVNTPSLSLQTTSATCTAPGSGTATVTGGSNPISYTWSPSAQTTSVATNLAPGIYTVTISDAAGCIKTATANLGSQNLMTATVTPVAVLCFGGSTGSASVGVGGGSGNYGYAWSNGPTTSSIVNVGAGVYTVTVQDLNNTCSITKTVQIIQPTSLSLTINSSTTNVCAGGLINVNSAASGGTAPYSYTWNPGPNTSAYNVSEAIAGNYNYVLNVTDANGCPITSNINLTFNPIPVVSATSQTICIGQKASLTASGADTYVWNPVNATGNTYTTATTANLYLTVIGTSIAGGCSSSATAAVIVNPLPTPVISASINKGCVPLCMTFTASNSSGAIQSCSWDFGDGSFASNVITTDRCFNMAGGYTVSAVITDANGCTSNTTFSLEAYPIPTADFNYAPIKPLVNEDVTFTDATHEAKIAKWDWYFMNLPKPHSNYQNPIFMYSDAGTYPIALVVTSDHGCTDTIVKTIIVGEDYGIFVPNIFSPNGDGLNDVFQPKGFGITKYELRIFNRWGEELMFTNDFNHGWDGFWKGKLSKEDTYVWKINLTNVFGKSHELSGNVTLIK